MKCDAVFEGGGVKGIAFVGAIQEAERRGFTFHRLAGTSAGSITASLLAAGYTGVELEEMMIELSFLYFLDSDWIDKIPIIGKGINLLMNNGLYRSTRIEEWISDKLEKKKITTFGDLPEDKLKIIASDLTNGRIMVIPDDLEVYGIEKRSFPIAKAVRMSSTIPYFFRPYQFKYKQEKVIIVDGALLSNFPLWIFDSKKIPNCPTFGFRLRPANGPIPSNISGPISLLFAIFSTMMEAHDRRFIERQDAVRTIFIPVNDIKVTDFDITNEQKKQLVELGRAETKDFFDKWSIDSNLKRRYNRR